MKRHRSTLALVLTLAMAFWLAVSPAGAESPAISGRLEGGFRILTVPPANTPLRFTVYRGDYVKFELPADDADRILTLPALDIKQRLPHRLDEARHITMRHVGVLPFTIGQRTGTIEVVDFRRPNYRELTAAQAADMIARFDPLILDVRTPQEYKAGHLANAMLLPVQVLQQNIERLSAHREREILIYCATGNRSTVASKILMDGGFKQIANLRHGIVDWHRRNYPVVR